MPADSHRANLTAGNSGEILVFFTLAPPAAEHGAGSEPVLDFATVVDLEFDVVNAGLGEIVAP